MISDKALLFKQSPAKVRFHPLLAHEMPLDGHADGCALHQSFHSIFGAVVVCHFRVCNPIFHTPFLHHFGVEQYRIT